MSGLLNKLPGKLSAKIPTELPVNLPEKISDALSPQNDAPKSSLKPINNQFSSCWPSPNIYLPARAQVFYLRLLAKSFLMWAPQASITKRSIPIRSWSV